MTRLWTLRHTAVAVPVPGHVPSARPEMQGFCRRRCTFFTPALRFRHGTCPLTWLTERWVIGLGGSGRA
jgi:hypothetical protein